MLLLHSCDGPDLCIAVLIFELIKTALEASIIAAHVRDMSVASMLLLHAIA